MKRRIWGRGFRTRCEETEVRSPDGHENEWKYSAARSLCWEEYLGRAETWDRVDSQESIQVNLA